MRVCHTEMAANGENVRWVTIYVCFGICWYIAWVCPTSFCDFTTCDHHICDLCLAGAVVLEAKLEGFAASSRAPSQRASWHTPLHNPSWTPAHPARRTLGRPVFSSGGALIQPLDAKKVAIGSHWLSGSSKHGQNHLLVLTQSIMSTMIIIVLVRPGVIEPSESCKPLYCFSHHHSQYQFYIEIISNEFKWYPSWISIIVPTIFRCGLLGDGCWRQSRGLVWSWVEKNGGRWSLLSILERFKSLEFCFFCLILWWMIHHWIGRKHETNETQKWQSVPITSEGRDWTSDSTIPKLRGAEA